ncbi:hypothetical protein K7432_015409 [Basidiobolus ranarum]|uniref:Uncharacterized protein n=1 Tax=Basidiobolus ranarum TaxID=34480 RepID=A0ABR2VNZ5_9FUNG
MPINKPNLTLNSKNWEEKSLAATTTRNTPWSPTDGIFSPCSKKLEFERPNRLVQSKLLTRVLSKEDKPEW